MITWFPIAPPIGVYANHSAGVTRDDSISLLNRYYIYILYILYNIWVYHYIIYYIIITLYVNLLTLLNCTYNVNSLSRDITRPPSLFQNSLHTTIYIYYTMYTIQCAIYNPYRSVRALLGRWKHVGGNHH